MTSTELNNVNVEAIIENAINAPLLTEKQVNDLIKRIDENGKLTRDDIQKLGFECLKFAAPKMVDDVDVSGNPILDESGNPVKKDIGSNYATALQLYIAVKQALNKRSADQLRLWFEEHGTFRWVKTKDTTSVTQGYVFRKDSKKAVDFDYIQGLKNAYTHKWYMQDGFTNEEKQAIIYNATNILEVTAKALKKINDMVENKKGVEFDNPQLDKAILEFTSNELKAFSVRQAKKLAELKQSLGIEDSPAVVNA